MIQMIMNFVRIPQFLLFNATLHRPHLLPHPPSRKQPVGVSYFPHPEYIGRGADKNNKRLNQLLAQTLKCVAVRCQVTPENLGRFPKTETVRVRQVIIREPRQLPEGPELCEAVQAIEKKIPLFESHRSLPLKLPSIIEPTALAEVLHSVSRSQRSRKLIKTDSFSTLVMVTRRFKTVLEETSTIRQVESVELQVLCIQSEIEFTEDLTKKWQTPERMLEHRPQVVTKLLQVSLLAKQELMVLECRQPKRPKAKVKSKSVGI